MNWKPISELPTNCKPTAENPATHALCWCESGRCIIGIYYDDLWQLNWDSSFSNDDEVPTHWCEITPPTAKGGKS